MDTPPPTRKASTTATATSAAAVVPRHHTSSPAAAGLSSMEMSSGTPMGQPGPTPMASSMGCCSPVGQKAFGYGAWTPSPMQTSHEDHVPHPGNYIPGNLWNLNLRSEVLEQAGPLGSFMRHTTSMAIPTSLVILELVNGLSVTFVTRTLSRRLLTMQWLTSATWSSSALSPCH